MPALVEIAALAILPALGIMTGALLAESMRTPKWLIGASLHATAGIAIALVSLDLMPRIIVQTPVAVVLSAFVLGAMASLLLANAEHLLRGRGLRGGQGAWMVYLAVLADLVSDGLMIGAGSAVGRDLGLLLAATQTVANIPGGFAATANLRDDGVRVSVRWTMAVAMLAPALISTGLGYALLRGEPALIQYAVLAAIVGMLLLATVEDVLPQGDAPQPPRWISTTAFTGGFVAMGLLSGLIVG